MKAKMQFKSLTKYKLPEGMEVHYIKKFVNGVTKQEFEYMFLSSIGKAFFNLAISNAVIGIATQSLKESKLI